MTTRTEQTGNFPLMMPLDPNTTMDAMHLAQQSGPEVSMTRYRELDRTITGILAQANGDDATKWPKDILAKYIKAISQYEGTIRGLRAGGYDPIVAGAAPVNVGGLSAEIEARRILAPDGPRNTVAEIPAHALGLGYGEGARGTLFTQTAGAPPRVRRARDIDTRPGFDREDMLDAIMGRGGPLSWSTADVLYFVEAVAGADAAERAEGAALSEPTITLTDKKQPIRSPGVKIPVTEEVLADGGAAVARYLDERLPQLVRNRINRQAVAGSGAGVQLQGVVNAATHAANHQTIDYVAATFARLVLAGVIDAQEAVMNNGEAEASHVVMNATVWKGIRKLEVQHSGGSSGEYVLGGPGDQEVARSLWGMGVIPVPSTTLPTGAADNDTVAVVGDFANFADFYLRKDAFVERGWEADQFGKVIITLRAYARCAFTWTRAEAFARIISNV